MLGFKIKSAVAIACFSVGAAHALGLAGTVKQDNGQPVAGVMIKVTSASAAALITKVFTDAKGEYAVPDLGKNVGVNSMYVETFKLGYEQAQPQAKALAVVVPKISKGVAQVDFILKPTANIAAQVPASAWLSAAPESAGKSRTVITCTQCHQMPNERTKRLAEGLAGQDEAQREQVWRAMVGAMRSAIYGALQSEHSPAMTPEQLAEAAKPENSFIDKKDEDIVAPWLAKYMPTSFDKFDAANKAKFANVPLGVTKKTVIREYPYDEKSFVRETGAVNGEYWVDDISRNRIGKLDPKTGAYTWYDVPRPGAPAPHTMVMDGEGNIWTTLLGGTGEMASMFNPKTGTWRIYGGFPKGMAAHDFSQGANYLMDFDKNNMNWMTIITHNKTIGFNRATGEVSPIYDLPLQEGETPFHIGAYGGGMTSDKNFWFAQYYGVLGRFNTDTRKVDFSIKYPDYAGPHRMVVDSKDIIYLTLIGSGQISVIDGKKLKEIKRIDLPDLSSAPYAISLDTRRNALWIATVNNDSLFKYDLSSGKFTEYPVGIKDLHMRNIAIDKKSGDLWIASSPIPSNESEMRRLFLYHPGDI
jgi:streptogramin lyase/cytochrome c553